MFEEAAKAIKRHAPGAYEFVKRVYRGSGIPAVKRLNGKWTLVAPSLVGAVPTEPHVLNWIAELLRPGETFFDVGAHVGWMSLVGCRCVGPGGRVVAFEPAPPLVQCLEYNKKVNRLRQMEVVKKAVTDEENRVVPLYVVSGGESFLNSVVDHRSGAGQGGERAKTTIQVETVTLDGFCERRGLWPDVVKIDVEGGELLVLRGSSRLLRERKAKFIVAAHPTWLPEGQTSGELFERFRRYGYEVKASQVVEYEGAEFGDYLLVPSGA